VRVVYVNHHSKLSWQPPWVQAHGHRNAHSYPLRTIGPEPSETSKRNASGLVQALFESKEIETSIVCISGSEQPIVPSGLARRLCFCSLVGCAWYSFRWTWFKFKRPHQLTHAHKNQEFKLRCSCQSFSSHLRKSFTVTTMALVLGN
jgi:hypothetical protein